MRKFRDIRRQLDEVVALQEEPHLVAPAYGHSLPKTDGNQQMADYHMKNIEKHEHPVASDDQFVSKNGKAKRRGDQDDDKDPNDNYYEEDFELYDDEDELDEAYGADSQSPPRRGDKRDSAPMVKVKDDSTGGGNGGVGTEGERTAPYARLQKLITKAKAAANQGEQSAPYANMKENEDGN